MCRAMIGYDHNEVLLTDCLQMGSADAIFLSGTAGIHGCVRRRLTEGAFYLVRTDNVLKLIIILDPLV